MDVATGKVTATDVARNDSAHFVAFLEQIESTIDPTLAIHIVLDNGSSHRSKVTKKWLTEHPRFVVHHTPVHASWLNQVEAFFSMLTRKVLRRSNFASRDDLVTKMLNFIEHRNHTATLRRRAVPPVANREMTAGLPAACPCCGEAVVFVETAEQWQPNFRFRTPWSRSSTRRSAGASGATAGSRAATRSRHRTRWVRLRRTSARE